jgi:hypothetical protein
MTATDQQCRNQKTTLANGAPFSNRPGAVKRAVFAAGSLAPGSWFSPLGTLTAAQSGPKRWHSNVHNGLPED